MRIETTLDFGEDLGRNLGTLFEARDEEGRVIFGAGFAGLYNTHFRMDRWTLQFFVRTNDVPTFEKLPPPTEDGGNYLFDLAGRPYQFSPQQDRTARWWDVSSGAWTVDPSFGIRETRSGEGMMRVGGKLLQFKGGQAWYEGEQILWPPEVGHYHDFYYACGSLVFYQNALAGDPPRSRLHAVPWKPGTGAVDLSRAITLDLRYPGESSFSAGQLGEVIVHSSNLGGVYAFDGRKWRVLRPSQEGVSHQLYSMLNWYDRMLIGHYPTGNLLEYDGDQTRHLEDWPPVMPGVSGQAREAQTTCLFGGDLYVGVWPWAELWRYDAFEPKWHFIRRMFEHPQITDHTNHPWEDVILEYNEEHGEELVWNEWGNRITGMAPMGDGLYVSTSAKGCPERDMRLKFLHDDAVWDEYRTIYRMHKPGCVAAAIEWQAQPTTIVCRVEGGRVEIEQDGKSLATASIPSDAGSQLGQGTIEWGHGMFGPLTGSIRTKEADL